jgi:hypothetical protein
MLIIKLKLYYVYLNCGMLIDLDHIVREYIYVNLNYVIHCTKDEEMVIAGPLLTCLCIYANEIGGKTYHQKNKNEKGNPENCDNCG